ncbi:hypothetical protein Cgig2_009594 [Carnegiea gigantea]|uniref:Uncharacterized protein n=1 Tax=Carnegiea gigantea TaxID=171969 RepID=A0A9Q1QGN1_9CARY|nr:hypothetical protein Cgig2_009594 [Carnegiea gigantea]
MQEQQQYFHGQDHFVGSCAPFNIPSTGYGGSPSPQWNPSVLLATTSTSNLISRLPYENEFHATSCGEPGLVNTVSVTTTHTILDNDAENYFNCPQPNNLPEIEEEDMLSSFPNFGGLMHNPITTSTMKNQSWVLGAPYSRGLTHQFPLEHDHALELDDHSPYDDNNMISWSTISDGFADASDVLNEIGLLTPSSPTSTSSVSSTPHARLGLNLLQAMDLFSGDNNAGFAGKSPQIYDHLVAAEVISSAIGNKIMSNKAGRKEKISEKVSALHQLVCPFGKVGAYYTKLLFPLSNNNILLLPQIKAN